MNSKVIFALLFGASAIKIKSNPVNEHLEATYILNDAVSLIETAGQEAYKEEETTNKDYIKELERHQKQI